MLKHEVCYRPRVPLWAWAFGLMSAVVLAAVISGAVVADEYRARSVTLVDNLHATGGVTVDKKLSAARVTSPVCMAGTLVAGRIDNWTVPCLATNTTVQVQAADNVGSTLSGIDATGFSPGDWLWLCNANAPQDDGVLAFQAEDTHSAAANRIWTPEYGRNVGQTNVVERATVGPSDCRLLLRIQPDQSDATTQRWLVAGSSRQASVIMKQLELFPYSTPGAITGTVNNWNPDDTCPGVGGPIGGSCEAAGNVAQSTYTVILASTVDASGAIVTGLAYTSSQHAEGQGPVKMIFNLGPGDLTLKNTNGGSTVTNQFQFTPGGESGADVVIKPGHASAMFWHIRDSGRWLPIDHRSYFFDERDVTAHAGLVVDGGGAAGVAGIAVLVDPPSAGVRFGNGNTLTFDYHKTSDFATSGPASVGGTLVIAGGAFTGGALRHVCSSGIPTANHGTLDTTAINCVGRIAGIGANTSVTLTYGADAQVPAPTTTSHCRLTVEGAVPFDVTVTPSATAPTFNCFTVAGIAANCPDLVYECEWN